MKLKEAYIDLHCVVKLIADSPTLMFKYLSVNFFSLFAVSIGITSM